MIREESVSWWQQMLQNQYGFFPVSGAGSEHDGEWTWWDHFLAASCEWCGSVHMGMKAGECCCIEVPDICPCAENGYLP